MKKRDKELKCVIKSKKDGKRGREKDKDGEEREREKRDRERER